MCLLFLRFNSNRCRITTMRRDPCHVSSCQKMNPNPNRLIRFGSHHILCVCVPQSDRMIPCLQQDAVIILNTKSQVLPPSLSALDPTCTFPGNTEYGEHRTLLVSISAGACLTITSSTQVIASTIVPIVVPLPLLLPYCCLAYYA